MYWYNIIIQKFSLVLIIARNTRKFKILAATSELRKKYWTYMYLVSERFSSNELNISLKLFCD